MLALIPLILQLLEAGVQIAPSMVTAARTELALVNGVEPATPEQQAQIDSALEAANNLLQQAQPAQLNR